MIFRKKVASPHRLRNAIAWDLMVDPRFLMTRQKEFMSVMEWTPPDTSAISKDQRIAVRSILNRSIKEFGTGWALWFHKQKRETRHYPKSEFPDPVSQALDDKRRDRFLAAGKQFETRHFVSLLYAPPTETVQRLSDIFEENRKPDGNKAILREYNRFLEATEALKSKITGTSVALRPLAGKDLLTYLKSRISTRRNAVRVPQLPAMLYEYLTDDDLIPGFSPLLGNPQDGYEHVRLIRINSEPSSTTPNLLRDLDALPFEFDETARWIPFSREDAKGILEKRRDAKADSRYSLWQQFVKNWTRQDTDGLKMNDSAVEGAHEAKAALLMLNSGDFSFGMWTHYVEIRDRDLDALNEKVRAVQAMLDSHDFVSKVVFDDFQSAWLGSIPGHPLGDLHRFLGSSQTFSDVLPSHTVWSGPSWNNVFDAPPLLRCAGSGGIPFNLSLHQPITDLSHTFVAGQSGAGKSTLLNTMIAAWRRYKDSQIFVIGKKGASKITTLALGGTFYDLEPGKVGLQPLAEIDEPDEFTRKFNWFLMCLEQEGLKATPEQKDEITKAFQTLSTRPQQMRTLTTLRALIQDTAVKNAMKVFCHGGAAGGILDSDRNTIGDADIMCFETLKLADNKVAVGPVMSCVWQEIRKRFNGRPTLVIIDECGLELDLQLMREEIRAALKLARYANVTVLMATQSLVDFPDSVRVLITESCPNRIYTSNSRALERAVYDVLASFYLSHEQIKAIHGLIPKREYAFQCEGGWRVFETNLSEDELIYLAPGSIDDLEMADRIRESCKPEDFHVHWLNYKRNSSRAHLALAAE